MYYTVSASKPSFDQPRWRLLDWPTDENGKSLDQLSVAASCPIDPRPWPVVDALNDDCVTSALDFRRRLQPRPTPLMFGQGRSGTGWAWLAAEIPKPQPLEVYAVETCPIVAGELDIESYGMTPPVSAYCTSLQSLLEYVKPWRNLAAKNSGYSFVVSAAEKEATEYSLCHDRVESLPLVPSRIDLLQFALRDAAEYLRLAGERGTLSLASLESLVTDRK
jgi:hypothetical protein